jgi:hypothetical protein
MPTPIPTPPNPHGSIQFTITVTDLVSDGVIDIIHGEIAGLPLVPVPHEDGRWQLAEQGTMNAVTYPMLRHYRSLDDWPPAEPPWVETYREWNELQHEGQR